MSLFLQNINMFYNYVKVMLMDASVMGIFPVFHTVSVGYT